MRITLGLRNFTNLWSRILARARTTLAHMGKKVGIGQGAHEGRA
jgi:hypothetical protein